MRWSAAAQTAYTQMLVNASRQYTREMAREVAEYCFMAHCLTADAPILIGNYLML